MNTRAVPHCLSQVISRLAMNSLKQLIGRTFWLRHIPQRQPGHAQIRADLPFRNPSDFVEVHRRLQDYRARSGNAW